MRRYVLPKLGALNFVLEGVLDGGVNESLNLDTHGKTLAFLLLSMEVEVLPRALDWRRITNPLAAIGADHACPARASDHRGPPGSHH